VKVGAWKNIDDLEDSLTLNELNLMVSAIREGEKQDHIFLASLQGVDLTKSYGNAIEDKKREIERRVAERLHGADAVERQEFAEFGIEFESE
jgi:hypothetical protein